MVFVTIIRYFETKSTNEVIDTMGHIEEDILAKFRESEYYSFLYMKNKGYYIDKIEKAINPRIKKRARNLRGCSGYQGIVDQNCESIKKFYESDFYNFLLKKRYNNFIDRVIFNALYIDPDYRITDSVFVDGTEIICSGDAILSAKKIYRYNKRNPRWIHEYKKYRNEKYVILKWPRHKGVTINTQRQACYNDKIDYALFDIKCFFAVKKDIKSESIFKIAIIKKCKMWKALLRGDTYKWLCSFTDFKDFIDINNLKIFVKENADYSDYDVIDIENDGILKSTTGCAVKWSKKYYKQLRQIVDGLEG